MQKYIGKAEILTLINPKIKLNVMNLAYTDKRDLKVRKIKVNAQKIDNFSPEFYDIVIAAFQILDKLDYLQFFQKTFLLTIINMEIILDMPFFIFNNINVPFTK